MNMYVTFRLTVRVVDVDVHRSVQGADQLGLVDPQRLVSSVDRLCFPVGPVHVLLEQRHGENVGDVLSQNCGGGGQNTFTKELTTVKRL